MKYDRPYMAHYETGPFDIIGDVHGCYSELCDLLAKLGWNLTDDGQTASPAQGEEPRKLVFLGDLVDRGPGVVEVLRLVMNLVAAGRALCLLGNHDDKLMRKLMGRKVQVAHGLGETLAQLGREPYEFSDRVRDFLADLSTYMVLDHGKLAVAHGGIREDMIGRWSDRVRSFTLYGDTMGEVDERGFPVRLDWAANYVGRAVVVYGHTPVREPRWTNNTINIDTGCVFGGKLTALRYPERDLVSVDAYRTYYERPGGI